jgi:hypothetical protein
MKKTIIFICILSVLILMSDAQKQIKQLVKPESLKLLIYDIEVTDIYLKNCFVWVKFTNKGTAEINHRLRVKVWVAGTLVRNEEILFDDFEAGKSRDHGYTSHINPVKINGKAKVRVLVNTTGVFPEMAARKANNNLTKDLICLKKVIVTDILHLALVDLTITSGEYLGWDNPPVDPTDEGHLRCTVKNLRHPTVKTKCCDASISSPYAFSIRIKNGNTPDPGVYGDDYFDIRLNSYQLTQLRDNGEVSVPFTIWDPGWFPLKITVDSTSMIPETIEGNNTYTIPAPPHL